MSLANKHEKYRKYGLGFPGLVSETEQLTIDDHAALSPRSDLDSSSSVGSSWGPAPTFTESPPPSEKSAEGEGSKSTSRASSAEHSPPALSAFSHVEVEDSTVSHAEVNGRQFDFRKINPGLVPKGWSNDPDDLEPVSRTLSPDEYSLQPDVLPVLASGRSGQASRCLFSVCGRFYFWTPASKELLYVTQSYKLRGTLKRIHEHSIDLKTQPLETLSNWNSQHQITHLPLWFWQIPRGWSQNRKKLKEVKELLDFGIEYGIKLPIPVLVDDHGTEYFVKCGDRYYLYNEIIGFLYRVEEPTELSEILLVLGTRDWEGISLSHCDCIPAYGGPLTVPNDEVPPGWSNLINRDVWNEQIFKRHNISFPRLLLFRDGGHGLPPLYLVEGGGCFYLWDTVSSDLSRVLQPTALQDIVDSLKGSSDKLTLSKVEP